MHVMHFSAHAHCTAHTADPRSAFEINFNPSYGALNFYSFFFSRPNATVDNDSNFSRVQMVVMETKRAKNENSTRHDRALRRKDREKRES